jgi:hypothetical protein
MLSGITNTTPGNVGENPSHCKFCSFRSVEVEEIEATEHDRKLQEIEDNFSFYGKIPVLSTFTGLARIISAIFQDTISGLGSVFGTAAALFTSSEDRPHEKLYQARKLASYRESACKNIGRGFVEMIPIIGNIVCWLWDKTDFSDANRYEGCHTNKELNKTPKTDQLTHEDKMYPRLNAAGELFLGFNP